MKLFNRKTKSTNNVEQELITKQKQVKHLTHTLNFLYPEYTDEQIVEKLIWVLSCIAEPKLLNKLVDDFNANAFNKLDEVADLYATYYTNNNEQTGE